jgi:ribosome-binding protein aMBF1 (putative translation factor)
MSYLLTSTGTAHIIAEDGDTVCGRDLEGEQFDSITEHPEAHVCGTCAGATEEVADEPEVEKVEAGDQLLLDVEPRPRGGRRHRRHLGF